MSNILNLLSNEPNTGVKCVGFIQYNIPAYIYSTPIASSRLVSGLLLYKKLAHFFVQFLEKKSLILKGYVNVHVYSSTCCSKPLWLSFFLLWIAKEYVEWQAWSPFILVAYKRRCNESKRWLRLSSWFGTRWGYSVHVLLTSCFLQQVLVKHVKMLHRCI